MPEQMPLPSAAPPIVQEAAPTRSTAQKRAAHALARIQELYDLPKISGSEKLPYGNYVSFAESLPAVIVMCGLGQALAFEMSRGRMAETNLSGLNQAELGHRYLAKHLVAWLTGDDGWECVYYRNRQDLLQAIFTGAESHYIAAQAEALLYLDWLKKFAVARLVKMEAED